MESYQPGDGIMNHDDDKDCDVKPNILDWENFERPQSPEKSLDTQLPDPDEANLGTETYPEPASDASVAESSPPQNQTDESPDIEEPADDQSRADGEHSNSPLQETVPWNNNEPASPVFAQQSPDDTANSLPSPTRPQASSRGHTPVLEGSQSPVPVVSLADTPIAGPSRETLSSPKVEPTTEEIIEPIDYSIGQRRPGGNNQSSGPHCVVDLTEDDDDDDISIIAMDTPVEFLYSEQRLPRRSRKRPRDHSEPGTSRDHNYLDDNQVSSSRREARRPEFFNDLLRDNVVSIEEIETEPHTHRTNDDILGDPVIHNVSSTVSDSPTLLQERRLRRRSANDRRGQVYPDDVERLIVPPPSLCSSHLRRGNHLLNLAMPQFNLLPDLSDSYVPGGSQPDPFLDSLDYFNKPKRTGLPEVSVLTVNNDTGSSQNPVPSTSAGSSKGPELACPICFEAFHEVKKQGQSVSSTICGHMFCTKCLEESLRQAKTCPTCRKKLTKKQYHTVYLNFLD